MKSIEVMVKSLRNVAIWLFVYAIVLTASGSILLLSPVTNNFLGMLIAVSPVIPVAFILHSIMQLLQHSDELQQRIQLLSIGFSAATTGLGTFAYGLLENYIGYPQFPPLPSSFILPIMVFLWAIGMLYFKWRYR
ncbi:MAG: hypothetical protein HY864_12255 [Chloroflexi bacterium]|nr:hypothetical protein [Chloroflexota bacterium]